MESTDVLDPIENLDSTKNTKRAFKLFIFSISVLFVFAIFRLLNVNNEFATLFFGIFLIIVFVTIIVGFIFTIRSFIKREPSSVFKNIAAFGNTILLLLNITIWGFMLLN